MYQSNVAVVRGKERVGGEVAAVTDEPQNSFLVAQRTRSVHVNKPARMR